MKSSARTICLLVVFLTTGISSIANQPIRVHPQNFRYFINSSGETVVLSGSHTWMRKKVKSHFVADGWDIRKFNRYLDFLQHWNHNYIRLWMWEHRGDVDIWLRNADGKYDLSKLNPAYFELVKSFVASVEARGMYVGVMLFQGWSGCCEASKADWASHPMHADNNINCIDGDPDKIGYGNKVHSLINSQIVKYQEEYLMAMINALNGFDNLIWEIGNETIRSSIPWKAHITGFIKGFEKEMPKQHMVLDGTGNGVGNNSIVQTGCDIFSPCVEKEWASPTEPYIANPPSPDEEVKKPVVLDNDHLGNHFLRHSALLQRQWTWKSFTRGCHPIHMDCYDVYWDGAFATPDHPIKGVATNPHYDPQRKSLGDILKYAGKTKMAEMVPVADSLICSTTFCLMNQGNEYIIYQPDAGLEIVVNLPTGNYQAEFFDTIDSSVSNQTIKTSGGKMVIRKPDHVAEDWVLYLSK